MLAIFVISYFVWLVWFPWSWEGMILFALMGIPLSAFIQMVEWIEKNESTANRKTNKNSRKRLTATKIDRAIRDYERATLLQKNEQKG